MEAHQGDHTPGVAMGLRNGFIVFIIAEAMLFAAWLGIFLSQAVQPAGLDNPLVNAAQNINPWHVPVIKTLLLLCSAAAATMARNAIARQNNRQDLKAGLWIAVGLAVLFLLFQAYEYNHAGFGLSSGNYGAAFLVATGFHGFHVALGTVFLLVCLVRSYKGHFSPERHVGLETAVWFWYFIVVIWLFLFCAVYLLGALTG